MIRMRPVIEFANGPATEIGQLQDDLHGRWRLPLYTEAFACAERSGDHLINFFLHNNAGNAAMKVGDLPAARAHLEAAAQAGQQIR